MKAVSFIVVCILFNVLNVYCENLSVNASRVCKPGPPVTFNTNKKCLVIGDSVSIGYTSWVKSALKDVCDVYHAPWDTTDGGALDTKYAVKCLQVFLTTTFQEKVFYDVIVFNFGLHDADFDFDNPEEYTDFSTYKKNLVSIKDALLATGSKIGYVLSTPVPFNVTANNRVKSLNNIAVDVMSGQPSVEYVDLYNWVVLVCGEPPYSSCEIASSQPSPHYTHDGYHYLSVLVNALFSNLLLDKSRRNYELVKNHVTFQDNAIKTDVKDVTLACKNSKGQTVTRCPGNMTCSPNRYSETGWGCCPLSDAVSCTDGKHCCPAGFECDASCTSGLCFCNKLANCFGKRELIDLPVP